MCYDILIGGVSFDDHLWGPAIIHTRTILFCFCSRFDNNLGSKVDAKRDTPYCSALIFAVKKGSKPSSMISSSSITKTTTVALTHKTSTASIETRSIKAIGQRSSLPNLHLLWSKVASKASFVSVLVPNPNSSQEVRRRKQRVNSLGDEPDMSLDASDLILS